MDNLLNTLFMPICLFCNKTHGTIFCKKCLEECKEIYSTNCLVCDKPSPLGTTHQQCITATTPTSSLSIFEYDGYVRKCIIKSKYSTKQFMALKNLTYYGLKKATVKGLKIPKDFVVVPIPISKHRQKTRGFNQALTIAQQVAKHYKLQLAPNLLTRPKQTKVQYSHNRAKRFKNVTGAFAINPAIYATKRNTLTKAKILLIDDIVTSGATLLEASKTLHLANVHQVHCLTLSKMEKRHKSPYNRTQHDQLLISSFANSASKTMVEKP
jgi:ComF family protein